MTSEHETGVDLDNGAAQHAEQPVLQSSESAYERLTGYGFARRYVEGKIVADISREEPGYGSRLLAETADSVTGLVGSPEALDLASTIHSSPNLSYQRVDLPQLPLPENHFDVVLAFGVVESLEHPEDLVKEIKRVLKEDGVLVVSALDRRTEGGDRDHGGANGRRGMYVPEFRELLGGHFGHVQVYRQGAVAGGFVFPASSEVTGTQVESARFSLTNPDLDAEPPMTRSVIAVCSDDVGVLGQEEQPYLLLDRDRSVFDECEERAEDVELMRGEIQRMQATEVQAFLDALRVQQSLYYILKRYPIHLRNIIHTIRTESRMYRRLATPYRWLRARNRNSG